MNNRVVAAAAAILLAGIPVGSAFARGAESVRVAPIEQVSPYDVPTTGSLGGVDGTRFDRCVGDSAAEGNANQQNFPVKQYGQTSGGPLC